MPAKCQTSPHALLTSYFVSGVAGLCLLGSLTSCSTVSMKYNDTFYVFEDSEASRIAVTQSIATVAHEFRFNTTDAAETCGSFGLHYELRAEGRRYYIGASISELHHGLADEDIVNFESLAAKLKQPAGDDHVSQYLRNQLSLSTSRQLSNYSRGPDAELQKSLIRDLRSVIGGTVSKPRDGLIYEPERFAGVSLSGETSASLQRRNKTCYDILKLNRMLLHDAYPKEIAPVHEKDEIRVMFGQVSFSEKKTNERLEIEDRLNTEFTKAFNGRVRIEQRCGWIP